MREKRIQRVVAQTKKGMEKVIMKQWQWHLQGPLFRLKNLVLVKTNFIFCFWGVNYREFAHNLVLYELFLPGF